MPDDGARFENMIALELFRAVSNWNDMPKSILKFQRALNIPALVLVGREEVYKRSTNAGHPILTVSAPWWLQGLP